MFQTLNQCNCLKSESFEVGFPVLYFNNKYVPLIRCYACGPPPDITDLLVTSKGIFIGVPSFIALPVIVWQLLSPCGTLSTPRILSMGLETKIKTIEGT